MRSGGGLVGVVVRVMILLRNKYVCEVTPAFFFLLVSNSMK